MRFRLRTLLIVLAALWLCAVAGAVVGQCAGEMVIPASRNLLFAIGWGTAMSIIPIGGMAAILADTWNVSRRFIAAASAGIAIASGLSLYIFAGITV